MPATLLFFRFISADHAEWLHADGTVQRGSLSELAAQNSDSRYLLVVSGESLNLHRVTLPSRKRATWSRAIPYLLEDQFAEDVDDLHFALGHTPEGDRLPVAVVAHETLHDGLNRCETAGVIPVAVIPDILLLPWAENEWSVLHEGKRAVVRTGHWEGFVTEADSLALMLELALSAAGDHCPQQLRLWSRDAPRIAAALAGIDLEISAENDVDALPLFAATYRPTDTLNLLQGAYSRQAQWRRWLQPWRMAAALAGLWLLAQGGVQLYEQWQLRQERVAIGDEMVQLFRQAAPEATRVVNPRVQMENRLRELRASHTAGGALFDLLYLGGQSLRQFSEITLRGFSYREGQLVLDLQGGSPAILDQLQQVLNQQPGLQAEIRTLQRDGRVESKVTLQQTEL